MAFSKMGGARTSFLPLSVMECNESSEIDGTCEKAPCPLEKSQSNHSFTRSIIHLFITELLLHASSVPGPEDSPAPRKAWHVSRQRKLRG